MEVESILHMNGGEGDASYALNSYFQTRVLSITHPLLEKAIEDFLSQSKHIDHSKSSFVMADLGCASGPNIMSVISTVVGIFRKFQGESKPQLSMEIQVYLNDLPGNDFNSIFRTIPSFTQQLKASNHDDEYLSCYIAGVPGTFHGRLFPKRSLHLAHASYSVHWLSKLPSGVCKEKMNKGRIYISKSSSVYVWKAYLEQFTEDFTCFLQHRSQEMVENGLMILTLPSRDIADPTRDATASLMKLLGDSLLSMVSEGLIEEEKLDSFHMPFYIPSPQEVEGIVSMEGSFTIEKTESFAVLAEDAEMVAKNVRSFTEPLISQQFGEEITDRLYEKFTHSLIEYMSKEVMKIFSVFVVLGRKI